MRVLLLSLVPLDQSAGAAASFSGAATVTRAFLRRWAPVWEAPDGACTVTTVCSDAAGAAKTLRRFFSILRAAMSGRPAKWVFQEGRRLARRLSRALSTGPFDLVVISGGDLWGAWERAAACLREPPPAWLLVHNIEAELEADQVTRLPGWLQPLLKGDVRRLRRFERHAFARADRLIFLCAEDRDLALRVDPSLAVRSTIEPVTFDGTPFRCRQLSRLRRPGPLRLGFLANFSWWPNRDGAEWFARDVLPRLRGVAELHLFGPGSPALARRLGAGVQGWGVVQELDRVWSAVDWMISPVRHGGGVRIKCAEIVWNGVPLITSRLGLRGVEVVPGAPVRVCETAGEWISAVEQVAAELASEYSGAPWPGRLSGARNPPGQKKRPPRGAASLSYRMFQLRTG